MYNIRRLDTKDYEKLTKWWEDWRWVPPAQDFLPEQGTGGVMVSTHASDVCAGFLYFTNSKVCWLEFIVSNFEVKDKKIRKEAIQALIGALENIARQKGFKYIYTVVKNESLENAYKQAGYGNGSKKVNELFKIL